MIRNKTTTKIFWYACCLMAKLLLPRNNSVQHIGGLYLSTATWRSLHSFFHGLILCLCLRYLDLDLRKSVRFILLENRWGFHQADALLQLLYCLSHQLGLLSLLSARCFQFHVKWYSSSYLYVFMNIWWEEQITSSQYVWPPSLIWLYQLS